MTTLFVAGVPKWSKDTDLKSLFEPFGEISDVSFTTTSKATLPIKRVNCADSNRRRGLSFCVHIVHQY